MKKFNKFIVPFFALTFFAIVSSCIIHNPKPENCEIVNANITKISEGSTNDIVFIDSRGDRYYINRGLEQGLNLQDLNASVLNKTVTLHLAKVIGGIATSEHIAQLAVDSNIIFTEFE